MTAKNWVQEILLILGMGLAPACTQTPPARTLPSGQIPLKVMFVDFGLNVNEFLISPLDGTPFNPPQYPKHSDLLVALDPSRPLPTFLQVRWTYYAHPFSESYDSGSGSHLDQPPITEWKRNDSVTLANSLPPNPEYLLLAFYPDKSIKAEILNQAQVDAGRMDQIEQAFLASWPTIYKPTEESEGAAPAKGQGGKP